MNLSNSYVHVAIPTDTYLELIEEMREVGATELPEQMIEICIRRTLGGFIEHVTRAPPKPVDVRGYFWKGAFLPAGTRVRMKYRNDYHYAEIVGDAFVWDGKESSPAQFANGVTSTMRNAWRDLELLFPQTSIWRTAENYRAQLAKDRETLKSIEL